MTAGVPGMRRVRIGTPPGHAPADLGLLYRDDELVETLRRRIGRPSEDRVTRLFHALLAEVDAGPSGRRTVTDRC